MTRSRLLASIALGSVLVLGAAACGDDSDTASTTTAPASGEEATTTTGGDGEEGVRLDITDFTFPADLRVEAGAEIEVYNNDSAPHTVTSDDDAWDEVSVEAGEEGTFTAPAEPGDYAYHCNIHQNMTATLTVT